MANVRLFGFFDGGVEISEHIFKQKLSALNPKNCVCVEFNPNILSKSSAGKKITLKGIKKGSTAEQVKNSAKANLGGFEFTNDDLVFVVCGSGFSPLAAVEVASKAKNSGAFVISFAIEETANSDAINALQEVSNATIKVEKESKLEAAKFGATFSRFVEVFADLAVCSENGWQVAVDALSNIMRIPGGMNLSTESKTGEKCVANAIDEVFSASRITDFSRVVGGYLCVKFPSDYDKDEINSTIEKYHRMFDPSAGVIIVTKFEPKFKANEARAVLLTVEKSGETESVAN